LAAENKHHLFLIWMIVEALPFAGEYDAVQDGEALGPGLSGAAHPPKLAPIEELHVDGTLEYECSAHGGSSEGIRLRAKVSGQ